MLIVGINVCYVPITDIPSAAFELPQLGPREIGCLDARLGPQNEDFTEIPLLHFVVAGALLFARLRTDQPRRDRCTLN